MIRNPAPDAVRNVAGAKEAYRNAGGGKDGKDAAKPFKNNLPCVMIGATGTRIKPEIATGLVNVDLDELGERIGEIRSKLAEDSHMVTVFVSPSGDGLKAAMRVPVIPSGPETEMKEAHRRNFRAMQAYCEKSFGVKPDSSTCDLLRLCYVSHDPECSLHLNAQELDIEKWSPTEKKRGSKKASGDRKGDVPRHIVEALLLSIPPRPAREHWLKISAAVRNSLGDAAAAIEMLQKWSPEEESGEYVKLLNSPLEQLKFGTLNHYAEEHGFGGVVRRFFYAGKGGFAMKGGLEFIPLINEKAVTQHLQADYGIHSEVVDKVLCRIREEQLVRHIGNIAGHQPGLYTFNGDRFLVTRGPKIIAGTEMKGTFVCGFLFGLLNDGQHPEQFPRFLCWLAHCRRAVIAGKRQQTPALALAGSSLDGKSLAIEIIKRSLGGRAEKAYQFFSGDDRFNSELAGAELLVADDDAASKDNRARHQLAQAIKSNLFASSMRVRGMHSTAFGCAPVHAVVFATNSDPQQLRVLPELDESMRDKIILMKTKPSKLPADIAGRQDKISMLLDEDLPGFLGFLDKLDLSGAYDQGRLKCFWHPDIVEAIGELSSEKQLLELIHQDGAVKTSIAKTGKWVGTASMLQGLLTERSVPTQHAATRLFSWSGACGTFLGRLADARGTGVSRGQKDQNRIQTYNITQVPPAPPQPGEGGV